MKLVKLALLVAMTSVAQSAYARGAGKACFNIEGMTCATCPLTVTSAVKKIKGVRTVSASIKTKNAEVMYDPTQTSPEVIKKTIDDVGYKATPRTCDKTKG